jgi:hypothetical protein
MMLKEVVTGYKRKRSKNETPTRCFALYVLVALSELGGEATCEQISNRTEELMRNRLHPDDYRRVHWVPKGNTKKMYSDYAPEGATDTWPVWGNKVRLLLNWWARGQSIRSGKFSPLMIQEGDIYTLTEAGWHEIDHSHSALIAEYK